MFTGRAAFEGFGDGSLAAIRAGAHRLSGNPAIDRVVGGCIAKSPLARFQSVQKLQIELRLLASTARRGEIAIPDGPPAEAAAMDAGAEAAAPGPVAAPPAPRSEMEALEARITARLEEQEKSAARVESVANELLKALRGGLSAPQPRPSFRSFDLEPESAAARMDRAFELLSDKVARIDLTLGKAVERLQKLEDLLESFDIDAAALRDSATRDIRSFERSLKAQSSAIESARTAMGQTDDLVERVVEALDSLQSMFMTAEERAAS